MALSRVLFGVFCLSLLVACYSQAVSAETNAISRIDNVKGESVAELTHCEVHFRASAGIIDSAVRHTGLELALLSPLCLLHIPLMFLRTTSSDYFPGVPCFTLCMHPPHESLTTVHGLHAFAPQVLSLTWPAATLTTPAACSSTCRCSATTAC